MTKKHIISEIDRKDVIDSDWSNILFRSISDIENKSLKVVTNISNMKIEFHVYENNYELVDIVYTLDEAIEIYNSL